MGSYLESPKSLCATKPKTKHRIILTQAQVKPSRLSLPIKLMNFVVMVHFVAGFRALLKNLTPFQFFVFGKLWGYFFLPLSICPLADLSPRPPTMHIPASDAPSYAQIVNTVGKF